MKTVGIIDLGSNSVRVSAVRFSDDKSYKIVFADKSTVKLSENMNSDMQLKPEAMERTITTLKEYKKIFDTLDVERIVAVATAAVRKAKNGEEFLEKVKREAEINIEIIDGKKEAEFDFLAVKNSMPLSDCIIMDIGGGSTEIIGMRNGELMNFISVPWASRNITEMYLSPETSERILNAEKEIFDIFERIEWLKCYQNVPIIGLGGCLRAIGKAESNKNEDVFYSGYKVDINSVKALYGEIKNMSVEKRIECIGKSKGDIILGGAMPFMSVIKLIHPECLYVSDKGVRDGIIYAVSNNVM